MAARLEVNLLIEIQTLLLLLYESSCSNANQGISVTKAEKSVSNKASSTPAPLPFKNQATEQRTVKRSIVQIKKLLLFDFSQFYHRSS